MTCQAAQHQLRRMLPRWGDEVVVQLCELVLLLALIAVPMHLTQQSRGVAQVETTNCLDFEQLQWCVCESAY